MFVFPRNSGHWFKPEFLTPVSERLPTPQNPTTNHQITRSSELPFLPPTTPKGIFKGTHPLEPRGGMGFQGDLGGRLAYPWSLWPQWAAENPSLRTRKHSDQPPLPQNLHSLPPTTPRGFSRGRIPLNQEGVMGFQGDLGGRLAYPWSLWPQRTAKNP